MFNAILFINLSVFNFLCRVHIRTTKIEPKKPLKKLTWKPINTKENYHVTHKYETIDHKKKTVEFSTYSNINDIPSKIAKVSRVAVSFVPH